MATPFEQITSIYYEAISHNDNPNLQRFLKSKMFAKITENLNTEVRRVQKTIKTDRNKITQTNIEERNVLIH